jgi:hypothetical protein
MKPLAVGVRGGVIVSGGHDIPGERPVERVAAFVAELPA